MQQLNAVTFRVSHCHTSLHDTTCVPCACPVSFRTCHCTNTKHHLTVRPARHGLHHLTALTLATCCKQVSGMSAQGHTTHRTHRHATSMAAQTSSSMAAQTSCSTPVAANVCCMRLVAWVCGSSGCCSRCYVPCLLCPCTTQRHANTCRQRLCGWRAPKTSQHLIRTLKSVSHST